MRKSDREKLQAKVAEERKSRVDQAEVELKSRETGRGKLLEMTSNDLSELAERCGVFFVDDEIECRMLKARIKRWPRRRLLQRGVR